MADEELKIYGRSACRAIFERRPEDIRRIFVTQDAMGAIRDVLKFCARRRLPYKVVDTEELSTIARARHHEGVCFQVSAPRPASLDSVLAREGPGVILVTAGVGNPHNIGALIRSAGHFGARAVLVGDGPRRLSGAAYRIAEGAAEWVDVLFEDSIGGPLQACGDAGYSICATSSHSGRELYAHPLPERCVLLVGAEREGLSEEALQRADIVLSIPGSGHVESLNVSAAAAVLLAEYWRQHPVTT